MQHAIHSLNYSIHVTDIVLPSLFTSWRVHRECTTFTIHVIKNALPTLQDTESAPASMSYSCHSQCRRDTEPFMSRRMPYLQVFLEFVLGCTATNIRWVQRDDILPFSVLDQVGHGACYHRVGRNGAEKGGVSVTAGKKRCIHFLLNVDNIKMFIHSVLFYMYFSSSGKSEQRWDRKKRKKYENIRRKKKKRKKKGPEQKYNRKKKRKEKKNPWLTWSTQNGD